MRLIDADALKRYIDKQIGRSFSSRTIGEAMKIITDEQPTVEEHKTGRWLERFNIWDDDLTYECSECGELWTLIDGTPEENNMRYCPRCGARMEEKMEVSIAEEEAICEYEKKKADGTLVTRPLSELWEETDL